MEKERDLKFAPLERNWYHTKSRKTMSFSFLFYRIVENQVPLTLFDNLDFHAKSSSHMNVEYGTQEEAVKGSSTKSVGAAAEILK